MRTCEATAVRFPLLLLILASCSEPPPPPRFVVTFQAESDPGEPLAGVTFHGPKGRLGTTDEDGRVGVAIRGREGTTVTFRVECPEGHKAEQERIDVKLARLIGTGPDQEQGLRVSVRCPPSERALVVAVQARGGGGLPVKVDGRHVATTDPDGVAHLLLRGEPGRRFVLLLDTTERERLRPKNPSRVVAIADYDKITVFSQPFEEKRKRRRRRRKRKPPPPPIGPVPL